MPRHLVKSEVGFGYETVAFAVVLMRSHDEDNAAMQTHVRLIGARCKLGKL
jgi:hypothetical protein